MTRAAYLSFDRFPAPKGSAVHIARFASALGREWGGLDLVTLPGLSAGTGSGPDLHAVVRHVPLEVHGDTTIARALQFRSAIGRWWSERRAPAEFIHFRSIFEGAPFARRKHELGAKLIYEVNGLPSIELKYHYPAVAEDRELAAKLHAQEQLCMEAADLIVTPSEVTAAYLVARGATREFIRVIPNGVDLDTFPWRGRKLDPGRPIALVYWGTMASWQGVHVALEALQLCRRDFEATLTLIGPCSARQRRSLHALCDDLEIAPFVDLRPSHGQRELAALLDAHDIALAPLMPNDRNLVQGCSPLKVIEAMAAGLPLVTSRMPVITDLVTDEVHALLVRPGSAKAIKDAVARLRASPALAERLARDARAHVERSLTWDIAERALVRAYRSLGVVRADQRNGPSVDSDPQASE